MKETEAETILQRDRARGQLTVWIRNLKFEGRGTADLKSSGTYNPVRRDVLESFILSMQCDCMYSSWFLNLNDNIKPLKPSGNHMSRLP